MPRTCNDEFDEDLDIRIEPGPTESQNNGKLRSVLAESLKDVRLFAVRIREGGEPPPISAVITSYRLVNQDLHWAWFLAELYSRVVAGQGNDLFDTLNKVDELDPEPSSK